jgi:hypothetical protein
MKLKTLLLTVLLSTSLIGNTYADYSDKSRVFNQGVKAYNDGDYKSAFRKWKSLTPTESEPLYYFDYTWELNSSNRVPGMESRAEYWIGVLYENGLGVLKSYAKASKHYEQSAMWGYPQGQLAAAKVIIKVLEGNLVDGLNEEDRLSGYKDASELISKLYENERATNEMRKEAEELWSQYELYKYPF